MVHFLSPKSRKRKGRLPPPQKKLCAVRGPSLADLFIHLLVHLFIDITIPLSVHSFTWTTTTATTIFHHCIYWKRAIRDWSECYTLCKVSNKLANGSNVSVDSLAFRHFGPKQGGVSWKNHPASKIWIVVYWKKASRDWSDCCTLYKVSNQFEYGLIALLGWKRSNVLLSHCTFTDVAFIRFGLDCKQKSAETSQPRGYWTFSPMNHSSSLRPVYVVKCVLANQKAL